MGARCGDVVGRCLEVVPAKSSKSLFGAASTVNGSKRESDAVSSGIHEPPDHEAGKSCNSRGAKGGG